jgi:nucleotide-binding universal stress UspA family protein
MIRKILLGYDGSASADKALQFAQQLARTCNAELHVLSVARPPEFGEEVETRAVVENSRRHYEHVIRAARGKLLKEPVPACFEVVIGHPAEQLVRYAEAHDIDHIAVGHRGHTLFERWLIGSVARQVIAYAPCAVTVVRERVGLQQTQSDRSQGE